MLKTVLRALRSGSFEAGVTTIEYAIMLALIAIAVAGFGVGLSGQVNSVFSRMLSVLGAAT